MTNDHDDGRPTAEVIPLHPDPERAPEVLPAVRGEVRETSYEIELDERGDGGSGPPVYVDVTPKPGERQPIIPASLRGSANIKATVRHHGGRLAHAGGYHGIRSPLYLLAALWWAVVGVFRVSGRQVRWWWVIEQHTLRSSAAAAGDSREWMRLHKAAQEARKVRGMVLLGEAAALVAVAAALTVLAPWWGWAGAGAVALPLLARAGARDRRIISPAVITPRFRKLTADIVLRAYYAAKLGDPEKPGQQVTFGSTMHRDGDGSRVVVDLPYGKGLSDAIEGREKIASGLDVQVSQVFIRRDPESVRRHVLWVADRDPLAVPVGRTPLLLRCQQTDIWEPVPFGLDERGQLVTVPLMWQSVLISALPRQGKSFAARAIGLACALDPYVKLDVFDFKGSPDWRKFAMVADSCAFGLTPARTGLPLEIFGRTLLDIKADLQDRYQRLSELPADVCPEGKLTREIARNRKYRMPVRS
jgi:DNA segregation ATPase FtsK/SpoIIIE, S-DNA-T family